LIVVSVHILLALLLVPSYQLLGAVISGGVSSVFGVILGMQWIARNLGTPLQFGIYFRLLASGAIAFAIAYLINLSGRHFSIDVLSILAYAVIYVMLTIKLRCWKEQDLQLVYYVLDKLPSPISTTVEKAIERIRSRAKS
jgi:hypothetical protein